MCMVWKRLAMYASPYRSLNHTATGESCGWPAMRPYQQSKAISVKAMSITISTAHTAVSEYRTFQGMRLIRASSRGSSHLTHATPIRPQKNMNRPEVRPSIDSHRPV